MNKEPIQFRCGTGYDTHRLVEGRRLVLGGVEIPFSRGLAGHSDGDVLSHAIADALLGAAALGDLGQHFPDTNPRWTNASSLRFLETIRDLLAGKDFTIANIDSTVVLDEPKLAPYMQQMKQSLATALGIGTDCVNVKAKTSEGVSPQLAAAYAVALLRIS